MVPKLFILRHGQTAWNAAHRLQGRMDSPLTEEGRAQARAQAEVLSTQDLSGARFYCSPQGRAFQTAALAFEGLAPWIETDARLREIDIGAWTGKRRDELPWEMGDPDSPYGMFDGYERAPGGEGFAALRLRCEAFLADLTGPAVIVTHGVTSRMLRLVALNRPTKDIADMPGGQGVVHCVENGVHRTL